MDIEVVAAAEPAEPTEPAAEPAQETPTREDLIIGVMGEPLGLVPQLTNDGYSGQVEYQLYSGLLTVDDQGELVGDIAESWDISDDGLVYTFTLRQDVTFHNGEKLTADDVKFTYDLGMASPQVADLFAAFDSVEVVDPYTVKVTLKQPYAPVLEKLSQPNAAGILCKKTYEEVGQEAYTAAPVGTGAYQLASWEKGVKLVLERFDAYHNGPAPIKTITLRFIPDATTATIAMQTGEIDMTTNVSLVDLAGLDPAEISVYEGPSTHLNWLAINTSVEPFTDARVRRAMEFAIDKDAVILAAMEGHATKAETI
ncbi:MAG TPA: ABC transporter substrate-binding protein, partial [Anaerolineaceae bacterium]|nr:ABC transporter substrate-binding protein [Anaerolineaceae bacterium]